ncbi:FAD-binding oxidoreductase [Roseicitreum antarcticum]|uniref:FAD/FMN-containing dehydrogenase n=1 Tax=Roseicitreum antarcticum TaxID=564137 RepID=A0A1H2VHV3_9RHOB|nr:FAD-binding oxidoreductase [Roseicitreum antarcticum]SDW67897.1 FAD/FMN-containing dehydrogenase [Roseicitreum antarcticum]
MAPLATKADLLAELRGVLGPAGCLQGADMPARNRTDWSFLPPADPLAVLRPASTSEVVAILRHCHAQGIQVTPQGGMTGLCGGARPLDGGVALSLERMSGVEAIDPHGMTMTVLAGTPLETIQKAAAEQGLFFPLDLGARGSCTIGGNIATNAGGNRVIRYGMTRDLVLGLEVVLPDGTVLPMLNKMIKNNAGYDLKQLFIGAEGTLGVVTRAVLRLYPQPGCTSAALCVARDYDAVLAVLAAARQRLGPLLSAFEVMWSDYWLQATTRVPGVRAPVEIAGGSHAILIEMQGLDHVIDGARFESLLEDLMEKDLVQDGAVAQSLGDIGAFWATRDAAAEFAHPTVIGPHISFDVGLPVSQMDAFAARAKAALADQIGCQSVYYGHVGDGNLHVVAWRPGADPQPLPEASRIVYGIIGEMKGTVSAEHGIGTLKKPYLPLSRGPAEMDLMRHMKAALDPQDLMNPTKIFDGSP